MIRFVRKRLYSDNIWNRIVTLVCIFCFVFFGVTIISYYLLPEGFLSNQNAMRDFETSASLLVCAFQIFFFNMISVLLIVFASLFSNKKNGIYVSYGYYCFVLLITLNAITLGTGSFSDVIVDVPLFERLISMFDITKHAGFIEMLGQILITCSVANKSLVMTDGKQIITRKIKEINCSKMEIVVFISGLLLMFFGALIESNTITNFVH